MECKFVAPTKSNFWTRSIFIHEGIKCTICEIRFSAFRELYKHKRKHKELQCKLCNCIAKFEKDFVSLVRKVHNQRLRQCSICELKGFSEQLKAHEKKHQHMKI